MGSSRAARWAAANGGALGPLSLAGGDLVAGTPIVLSIVGATAGSTITATGLPVGWTLNSGARTLSGTPSVDLDAAFTLDEALGGKANSPRRSALRLRVPRPVAAWDPVAAEVLAFGERADPWAAARGAPVVAIIGDSIVSPDAGSAASNRLKLANGVLSWAMILSHQRVISPPGYQQANPSQQTSVILANLPAFIDAMAIRPGAIVVECGTNNVNADATSTGVGSFASITADWTAIATLNARRGIRTIFVPILPRTSGISPLWNGTQFDTADRCNRWLANFAQQTSGMVAAATSCLPKLTDPASVGGQPRSGITYDGTHPAVPGAFYVGQAISRILTTWFPPLDLLPSSNLTWSASSPYANLIDNSQMQGAAGAVNAASGGGTASGTAPTGWTAANELATGLSVAHAPVVSSVSGITMHQMTFSGSHTVAGATTDPTYAYRTRLFRNASTAATQSLIAGDTVEALIYFEIDAGQQGLAFPFLEMRWKSASNYNRDCHTAPSELPNEAITGVLRTFPHTYVAGELPLVAGDLGLFAGVHLKSFPNGAVTDSAVVRFGRAVIQKVAG